MSHAWKYLFVELVDALEQSAEAATTAFWLDLAVNDQWNAPSLPYEWWTNTFRSAVGQIGHTQLVLLPWDNQSH